MKNTLRVWRRDCTRLFKAPAALIVVIFLIVLPSLYAWLNVYGFMDPYGHTGNMRVCVVNEDKGAYTQATGRLDLGDQIVDALHENDQLGWVFTDRATAEDEVESGKAYAAFVIPEDFSEDITTFLTSDIKQPKLEYYVNEKAGAVSPKITDSGATTLDETINSEFVSAISNVVVKAIDEALAGSSLNLADAQSSIVTQLQSARGKVSDAQDAVNGFTSASLTAKDKVFAAQERLQATQADMDRISSQLVEIESLTKQAREKVMGLALGFSTTFDEGNALALQAAQEAQIALDDLSSTLSSSKDDVNSAIATTKSAIAQNELILDEMHKMIDTMEDGPAKQQLQTQVDKLEQQNEQAKTQLDELQKLETSISSAIDQSRNLSTSLESGLEALSTAESSYRALLANQTLPTITNGLAQIADSANALSAGIESQKLLVTEASAIMDQLEETLDASADASSQTDSMLADLASNLATVQTDIASINTSSALAKLISTNTLDADKIAEFMLSPTELQTEVLYPLNAYGSAMAPLFMNLTLWIGVFMLMVILRHEVDDEGIPNLTPKQRYLGRLLFLAPITILQAVVCCTGILIIGVQTVSPPLFYLTAILASLTYLCIQFALVVTMQHIGMGLCIVLVFVQIPGATGLYPIEMTTEFFRNVYPLFPFTYGINALRETIAGFYGNLWAIYIARLFVFAAAFFLIGLIVRPYLTNLNRLFAKEIKKTGIINGEDAQIPPRRFRAAQIVGIMVQRDETRKRLRASSERFITWYPIIIRGLIALGVGVPALLTLVLSLLGVEKVVLLTLWLVWLIAVLIAMVVIAYIRDNLERLNQLNDMSNEELSGLYANTDNLEGVPVSPMHGKREVSEE